MLDQADKRRIDTHLRNRNFRYTVPVMAIRIEEGGCWQKVGQRIPYTAVPLADHNTTGRCSYS